MISGEYSEQSFWDVSFRVFKEQKTTQKSQELTLN
jgi:hypothetical protein